MACATGSSTEGSGDDTDSGAQTHPAGDGGGDPYGNGDSGAKDGAAAADGGKVTDAGKEGGITPIDSGPPPVSGQDCSGSTSSSGESYSDECDEIPAESDCTKGGGECGAGTCCTTKFECYLDWFGPQCVPL
ncbi:MAG TPA: hypothetical protein VF407_13635 [Polyangiaceae bacterium]